MTQYAYIDAEYCKTQEPFVTPICCVIQPGESVYDMRIFDARTPARHADIKAYVEDLIAKEYVFVSYNAQAEARFLHAIGIDIRRKDLKFIDLYVDFRLLTNQNNDMQYGDILSKTGKPIVTTPPPTRDYFDDWSPEDEDEASPKQSHMATGHSLACATYKLLGVVRDTVHKTKMRDLCIAGGPFTDPDMHAIMKYCAEDVRHLPELLREINKAYSRYLHSLYVREDFAAKRLLRARFSVLSAYEEHIGMPVNVAAIKRFITKANDITRDIQEDVNARSGAKLFRRVSKSAPYSLEKVVLLKYLAANVDVAQWPKTPTGALSTAKKAWEALCSGSPYPDTVPGQYMRWLKFSQSLTGMKPPNPASKNQKTIMDYVGSDGRCRPYFGIFGSQTGRNQPASTTFIPLKAKMFRSLLEAPPGKVYIGFDYGSEEVLIAACLSGDTALLEDYNAQDYYIAIAKRFGIVPPDATKKSHPAERALCKTLALGIGFGMGVKKLATSLKVDEDRARELKEKYWETYYKYEEFRQWVEESYKDDGFLELPHDGWAMCGDNTSYNSILNCPVQGAGASVMRLATAKAIDAGLQVSFSLHDAIYVLADEATWQDEADLLAGAMQSAFVELLGQPIRLDGEAWGPCFLNVDAWEAVRTPGGTDLKVRRILVEESAEGDLAKYGQVLFGGESWKDSILLD